MLRFDKALYLSLFFNLILTARLRNSLWGSDVLLFLDIVWLISFNKFSDVIPACTRARAICNLWSICFGLKILSCFSFGIKNHLAVAVYKFDSIIFFQFFLFVLRTYEIRLAYMLISSFFYCCFIVDVIPLWKVLGSLNSLKLLSWPLL